MLDSVGAECWRLLGGCLLRWLGCGGLAGRHSLVPSRVPAQCLVECRRSSTALVTLLVFVGAAFSAVAAPLKGPHSPNHSTDHIKHIATPTKQLHKRPRHRQEHRRLWHQTHFWRRPRTTATHLDHHHISCPSITRQSTTTPRPPLDACARQTHLKSPARCVSSSRGPSLKPVYLAREPSVARHC